MAGSSRFESAELTLRRRNRLFAGLAVAAMIFAPLMALAAFAAEAAVPLLLAPLVLLAGALLWRKNPAPVERLGRLSIGPLGVFFEGKRLASAAGARACGVVFDPDEAPLVRLTAGGRRFEVRVPDVDEAQRLLDALQPAEAAERIVRLPSRVFADPGQLARFAMYAVLLTIAFPIVGLAWHIEPAVAVVLLVVAVFASAALVTGLASDTVIALKPNGLLIVWLFGRRFVPFEELEAARLLDEARDLSGKRRRRVLALHLRRGEVLRFPADDANADQLALVLQHVRSAPARAGGSSSALSTALERRGMSLSTWIEGLRALARGDTSTHRTAPVAHETFWRVVEDETARAETRAAAAVVLLESLGDDARPRVRIAAMKTSAPRARIALESAAAANGEAELEMALAEAAEDELSTALRLG